MELAVFPNMRAAKQHLRHRSLYDPKVVSEMVSYVHCNGMPNVRFRQYRKDPIPSWATDIRPCE